jgi:hypothetical protein
VNNQFLSHVNLATMIAAALLVLAVILVIRIGKALLTAGILGAMAGGASLGEGNPPTAAATHAAIAFAVAAVTLFLIRVTKGIMVWLLVTAVGVAALLLHGFGR